MNILVKRFWGPCRKHHSYLLCPLMHPLTALLPPFSQLPIANLLEIIQKVNWEKKLKMQNLLFRHWLVTAE